jgi:rhodanese-related sulfurtransferase
MNVYDLEELELAYAPPYSSAKDPVNIAGFVAANSLKGDMTVIYPEDLENINPETDTLVDLRTPLEIRMMGTLKGSVNIPVDDLRDRLNELDPSKNIIVYCAIGLRGYIASRILSQNGFRVRNLSGGFTVCGYLAK